MCAVDGGYSPWSTFGECSVTCGNGVQKRERSCDSPAPMFDGLSCDKLELGPSVETKECRKDTCPGEIPMSNNLFCTFTLSVVQY